jgi:hypothetical protein
MPPTKDKNVAPAPPVETTELSKIAPSALDLANFDLSSLSDIEPVALKPQTGDPLDLAGTEDIDPNEIRLPRLAVAQGLSPQMIPTEGTYIKGLELFTMFNDVTSEMYGNGPLTVVPVQRHVTRIEFDPLDQKVPLDREVPANDPRTKWTKNEKGEGVPPRATEFVEFTCLLLRKGKAPEPIVVSIKTTNKYMRAAAELWTTFIKLRGTAIYRGMYHIISKAEKGKTKEGQDTNFGVFVVKNAGFLPIDTPAGAMLLSMAKDFYESLQGKTIIVNREGNDAGDTSFNVSDLEAGARKTEM